MPYTRRPTWPDQPACLDYIVQREDLRIGRVQLTKLPNGDRFVWSIYFNDTFRKYQACRSGCAATLDKATAAISTIYGFTYGMLR